MEQKKSPIMVIALALAIVAVIVAFANFVMAQVTTPTADSAEIRQRNPANNGTLIYYAVPIDTTPQLLTYNGSVNAPEWSTLGAGLSRSGTQLTISPASTQISDSTATGRAVLTAANAAAARTAIGAGTSNFSGAYADLTGVPTRDYGDPTTRSLSASTAYQASDPSKPANITLSLSCRNQPTLLAASACTAQVRYGTSGLNCSNGTVYATWTSTFALGLVLDTTSGTPFTVKLGIGKYFIICPTAGAFTIGAVDQTAT